MTAPQKLLVVRLGAMGDILHTLPAAASLKASFPAARLTWAVEPRWMPLLEGNPHVDRLVPVDRRSLAGVRAAWRELRRERADLAIDFQGLIKSALVAKASGADCVVGYADPRERPAAVFYTARVRAAAVHIVDRHLEMTRAAGATNIVKEFALPAGRQEYALPEGPFVLASPQAGWQSKQWPTEYYDELARLLPCPLVLDQPGKSTLYGLIFATRRAAAVVGVDSGPMHLAAALGKPGVAIFGPTDPARNGPYGGSMAVMRSPDAVTTYKRGTEISAAMRAITPQQVAQALAARLVGCGA